MPLVGAVPTIWRTEAAPAGCLAIDSRTRDADLSAVADAMARCAPLLAGADIAFKKIDSLLRGHVSAELTACLPGFDHCVLAPAFPFQGRITRGGRQYRRDSTGWTPVGPATLPMPLRDAETDDDLDAIVAAGRALRGRVLWCGTAGLAGALAGRRPVPCPALPGPVLALIGSDHDVTQAQLAALGSRHHRMRPDVPTGVQGPAAVSVDLPIGTARPAAHRIIVRTLSDVLAASPRPSTLMISGGETLRGLCDALGASRLDVDGEIEPGVPTAILRGGTWDGQRIVAKSGAFGDVGFLVRLLRAG